MNVPLFSVTVIGSIIATGLLLNAAGRGNLGATMQKVAKYTTEGYGV